MANPAAANQHQLNMEPELLSDAEGSAPKKLNHHVVIALRHMNRRRAALLDQRAKLTKEIEELDAAILALE